VKTYGKFHLWNRECVLSPMSTVRMVWDLIGVFVLAYDLIEIPMQVFSPPTNLLQIFCGWFTLLYWTLDMGVSCVTGFWDKDGHLVLVHRRILWRYFTTWFPLDVIVLSVDWMQVLILDASAETTAKNVGLARIARVLRSARIFRSIRLLRLMKLREIMFAIQERINSESIVIMIGLFKNTVLLLALNHFIACTWFWIGSNKSMPTGWIREYEFEGKPWGEQYLVALHWSLTQFTPASMFVQPHNVLESLYTVIVLVLGMLVFSSFVSSNTMAVTRLRNITASEDAQFFLLRKFLKENSISKDLSARVTRYIDLAVEIHKKQTSLDKVQVLGLLTGPLNVELGAVFSAECPVQSCTYHSQHERCVWRFVPLPFLFPRLILDVIALLRHDLHLACLPAAVESYMSIKG